MIQSEAGRVPTRHARFAALDGWRGVCALLVALHHLAADTSVFALPVVRNAWLCVDFFFVLSGFVLAHAEGPRLHAPRDLAGFVVRRLGRLWPLHAVVLGAFVAVEAVKLAAFHYARMSFSGVPFAAGSATSPAAILSNLALVQALDLHADATWNGPAWSICVEFWTSLVFAALVLPGRRLGTTALLVSGLAAAALAAVSTMKASTDFGLLRCLYGFFLGVLMHGLWARAAARGSAAPAWAEPAATIAAIAILALPLAGGWLFLAPPVFGLAVLVFAFEAGPVSRLLTTRPAQWLGARSYSVYMVHWLVIALIASLVRIAEIGLHRSFHVPFARWPAESTPELVDLGARWLNDLYAAGYLAAVLALAALTFRSVEEPARLAARRLARAIGRERRPAPPALPKRA